MKIKLLITLTTLALTLSLHAQDEDAPTADPKKPDMQARFAKKDRDNDGFLSKEEFARKANNPAKAEATFDKKDTNKDGKLSIDEFTDTKDAG